MEKQAIQSRYRLEGMDCASCAAKIEGAARRVAGIDNVAVSVATRSMTISHKADADLKNLEKRVRALGYGTKPLSAGETLSGSETADTAACSDPHDHNHAGRGHAHAHDSEGCCGGHAEGLVHKHAHDHVHGPGEGPWYRDPKLRRVIANGLALLAAWGLARAFPAYGFWFFSVAMLVGLVPIARRAVMGAVLAGAPFSIETLMTIAAIGAVVIGATHEAAVVVFLFLIGELLEDFAAGRARASISALSDLVPKTTLLVEGDVTREVPAKSLKKESLVLVRPGDRIPADGIIESGESGVDEAPVTGESVPVQKQPGSQVFAGTINGEAVLRIRVTAAAADNTIARVVQLVEQAQESKAPTERFIDRFSRYYTPGVVLVAAIVAVLPPLAFGAPWGEWIYKGLAILLIGCPCALVISTPAAVAASLASGARRGLLIKGGAALEMFGRIGAVAFDKTGTLTEGRPKVTDIVGFGADEAEVLRLAAALEAGSNHPLAKAILERAADLSISLPPAENAKALGGKGVTGRVEGRDLFLGSVKAAAELASLDAKSELRLQGLRDEGKSVSVLVADNKAFGALAMRDEPRSDAVSALKRLAGDGLRTIMLTGDNARTAQAVGRELGIEVHADLLPQDKQRIVAQLQAEGVRVAKVGDGINDAPALAAADVGVAMGGGTDVALETGDAASLHGRVDDVAEMIALSKRTMANIRQNITIALGLKAVFLVTTVMGITGLWPAILADTGATVLVTANALRLLVGAPAFSDVLSSSGDRMAAGALTHDH
ncbi:heavy metal translocating P-type ATPase [Sinorhizobium alkalisoli]|uniref:heavy metal translocating P-type ATPase n=1 Tax=Sinorhizobium alkalisoli TaxID=1752398 RepID=UPI0012A89B98|nr:heavy metal translocating P-type ATPase [Sinorhizobium alkalisoli]QFI69082.1 Lead, cadmium, zinc and mercury transporting ATPase [Sinorhizobium alkalisoli]